MWRRCSRNGSVCSVPEWRVVSTFACDERCSETRVCLHRTVPLPRTSELRTVQARYSLEKFYVWSAVILCFSSSHTVTSLSSSKLSAWRTLREKSTRCDWISNSIEKPSLNVRSPSFVITHINLRRVVLAQYNNYVTTSMFISEQLKFHNADSQSAVSQHLTAYSILTKSRDVAFLNDVIDENRAQMENFIDLDLEDFTVYLQIEVSSC